MDALLTLPYIGGSTLSTSNLGRFLVFTYLWLPFMVLPIQAALERVPPNLLQASADLGAGAAQTFRFVTWPLAFPGVVQAETYLQPGEVIRPVRLDGDRRGYVIAIADTNLEALEKAEAAARLVDVEVEAA